MSGKVIRAKFGISVFGVALAALLAWTSQPTWGEPASGAATDDADIALLIKQLDSESFREREAAHQALVELPGTRADELKKLRESATSPEIRGRLEQIIEQRCSGSWNSDLSRALAKARSKDQLVMVFSTHGPADGYS